MLCNQCGQKMPETIMGPLTTRQRDVYNTIRRYQEKMGVVPTYTTLAELLGLSSLASVHDQVQALKRKGWLTTGRRGEAQSMILLGD